MDTWFATNRCKNAPISFGEAMLPGGVLSFCEAGLGRRALIPKVPVIVQTSES